MRVIFSSPGKKVGWNNPINGNKRQQREINTKVSDKVGPVPLDRCQEDEISCRHDGKCHSATRVDFDETCT